MRQHDLAALGLDLPKILLPRQGVDLAKWAVVACDQYTAEPEYWEEVARLVATPLHAAYSSSPKSISIVRMPPPASKASTGACRNICTAGILVSAGPGFVYLERRTRRGLLSRGLLAAVDLERYDYRPGARTLIRATEGIVLERIPPRGADQSTARPFGRCLTSLLLLGRSGSPSLFQPLYAGTHGGLARALYGTELMVRRRADPGLSWWTSPEPARGSTAGLQRFGIRGPPTRPMDDQEPYHATWRVQ